MFFRVWKQRERVPVDRGVTICFHKRWRSLTWFFQILIRFMKLNNFTIVAVNIALKSLWKHPKTMALFVIKYNINLRWGPRKAVDAN